MCNPCILIMGCPQYKLIKQTYSTHIYCLHCQSESVPALIEDRNYFTFCFIPCCCYCNENVYLGCRNCKCHLDGRICSKCQAMSDSGEFCGNCGTRKEMGGHYG